MAKKKKDTIALLSFRVKRPKCSKEGCERLARRTGKRMYSGTCEEHKPVYGAA